jgi:hypothetical protein
VSLRSAVWGRIAHLIDPDLKGWPTAVRIGVKRQDSAVGGAGCAAGIGAP